jgi:hypothetical protein
LTHQTAALSLQVKQDGEGKVQWPQPNKPEYLCGDEVGFPAWLQGMDTHYRPSGRVFTEEEGIWDVRLSDFRTLKTPAFMPEMKAPG